MGPALMDGGSQLDGGQGESGTEYWIRVQVMSGLAELPAFGLKLSETIGFVLSELRTTEDGLYAQEETCAILIRRPEVPDLATIIPDAFVRSIPLALRAVSGQEEMTFADVVEIHGAHLVDRYNEALPEDATDPRVYDQDQDGKPGVTVQISGILDGDVQLVQRVTSRLSGTRIDDRLTGLVSWSTEDSILSASNPLLEMPIPFTVSESPELSWFVAWRQSGPIDCQEVALNRTALLRQAVTDRDAGQP
jgi:hypothetical protein